MANSSEGHVYTVPLENGHWVDAAELQAGDLLLSDDGIWAEVVAVEIEAKPLKAFNLAVSEFHTYFVAASSKSAPVRGHDVYPTGATFAIPSGKKSCEHGRDERALCVLEGGG